METLEIKLLVRDEPMVTQRGPEKQPVQLGSVTGPIAGKLCQ